MDIPTISDGYRELNRELHESRADYGKRSADHLAGILQRWERHDTVLDYGCGKNTLVPLLRERKISAVGYDPCVPELSVHPGWADIVVCTDVLEHIEPDLLKAVILDLAVCTDRLLYCQIALRLDSSKLLPDGSNPHKIVEPWDWWRGVLHFFFEITEVIHHKPGKQVLFTAKPRKALEVEPLMDTDKH